jgi:uncharacterized protein
MDPVVFKTNNGNCYLYSPAKKELMPIPLSLYNDISDNGDSANQIWMILKSRGYLQSYNDKFEGVIDEYSIKNALKNLSQIVFETTTSCNLRCEYCCYGEGYNTFESRKLHLGHLKFDKAKAILDYLSSLFKKEVLSKAPHEPFAISFYGGEPLMNFNVVKEIVEYAERIDFQNRNLFFTMTTNATLLAKHADFLQSHKFKLLISLDGDKPHDAYRKTVDKTDSFEIVMHNLQKVKEKYPDWFSTFRYNSVYTDISNAADIIKWFRNTFNTVPNFSPLHTPTVGAKDYVKIKSMTAKFEIPDNYRFSDELLSQSPINKRVLEFCNTLFQNTIDKEANMLRERQIIPTGTCIPLSKRMFVSFDGKIHPCEKVNRDFPLGEINCDGTISIDFKKIAEDFMNKLSVLKPTCQRCYLQLCCTKCMLCFNGEGCADYISKSKFISLLTQTITYVENHPNVIPLLKNNIIIK